MDFVVNGSFTGAVRLPRSHAEATGRTPPDYVGLMTRYAQIGKERDYPPERVLLLNAHDPELARRLTAMEHKPWSEYGKYPILPGLESPPPRSNPRYQRYLAALAAEMRRDPELGRLLAVVETPADGARPQAA